MGLVRLQYKPMNLDVNEACFEEEQDTSNTREKSWKSKKGLLSLQ